MPANATAVYGYDIYGRSMVTFRCAPSFRLTLENFALTCTMRGWEAKENIYAACLPDCQPVRVPDTSDYNNGLADPNDSKRGFKTVHYRCLPGYTIHDNGTPDEHFHTGLKLDF